MKRWVTKDKRVIPINKLKDDHLKNCIRMLARNACVVVWNAQYELYVKAEIPPFLIPRNYPIKKCLRLYQTAKPDCALTHMLKEMDRRLRDRRRQKRHKLTPVDFTRLGLEEIPWSHI